MQVKAVIFDLDGTLIDSLGVWEGIDHKFLTGRGIAVPEDIGRIVKNMSLAESAEYFISRFSLNYSVDELIKIWNEMAYEEYAENIPLKPGVRAYLLELSARRLKLAVATASERRLVEAVLARHALLPLFHTIVTVSEVGKGKGQPDIFLRAASLMEVEPEGCLVFEDSLHGVIGAKKAGMKVWGVYDPWSAHERLDIEQIADRYIDSFLELEGDK